KDAEVRGFRTRSSTSMGDHPTSRKKFPARHEGGSRPRLPNRRVSVPFAESRLMAASSRSSAGITLPGSRPAPIERSAQGYEVLKVRVLIKLQDRLDPAKA